ncbi:agamous-like MADS-box protein AGL21 [Bidens hawaiensis]|uniref:agamous-like MADS-box protein AGL21 n=1 Tax=Bidens hawaiensis TaxID=980011 RepID=UPI00404A82DF
MGEEISNMGLDDLKSLENQLEMSLRCISSKKDELLIEEIQDLTRKGSLIHQQNIDLYKKIYGASVNAENLVIEESDSRALMNLQLSQLEHETQGLPSAF